MAGIPGKTDYALSKDLCDLFRMRSLVATMKVLLVNPPSPYLENAAAYPPMGLLYVASALEKEGCEVTVQDMAAGDQFYPEPGTDLIGFTCVTPNVNQVKRLLGIIGHLTPTMIGGAHPTFVPAEPFYADLIVMGEFENIAGILLHDLATHKVGKIYAGGFASPAKIGVPARHLVDMHQYTPGGEANTTPIYTSRGCVYDCAFCCQQGKGSYRRIPLSSICQDLNLIAKGGFRNLVIGDDNFFLHTSHAQTILEYIKDRFTFNIRINTDARHLPVNLLDLAKEAGCTEISMGIESGSQQMLDAMRKRTTVSKNKLAIKFLKDMGIFVKIYLVCNFPGETDATVEETLEFVRQAEPDKILVSNFAPMPGCDVHMHPEKYGVTWMSKDWDDYYLVGKLGGFVPCFTTDVLTKEQQLVNHTNLRIGLIDQGFKL
jgi:anaerobic magnesium-protoporphyrin IX monomethyl ester cyclase